MRDQFFDHGANNFFNHAATKQKFTIRQKNFDHSLTQFSTTLRLTFERIATIF